MIISVEQAEEFVDLKGWSYKKTKMKLDSIEQAIRSYTNNNFQNRAVRSECTIQNQKIIGQVPGLKVGDTVQISQSAYNNCVQVVTSIEADYFTVDREMLIDEPVVLITKVEYPADVVECCVNLLEWDVKHRDKVGIQSETLSRHSVTYFGMDASNTINGYPAALFGCLKAYRKCRC